MVCTLCSSWMMALCVRQDGHGIVQGRGGSALLCSFVLATGSREMVEFDGCVHHQARIHTHAVS